MKLLLVTWVDPWVQRLDRAQMRCRRAPRGHDIAVYGEPNAHLPAFPSTDLDGVDLAVFVVQVAADFPDMPYLARVLDGIPRERRLVIDLWGRFNDTIRLEHDFNHLQKLDGHAGWEWEEAFQAVSDTILQPTLAPLRPNVGSFLFHGWDPGSVVKPYRDARSRGRVGRKSLRRGVCRQQLATLGAGAPVPRGICPRTRARRSRVPGRLGLERAAAMGRRDGHHGDRHGSALLACLGVEARDGVRFDEVVGLLGRARFAPVIHRPLFRHLGFVTNRTFETFYADSLPVLMLPRDFVAAIYGEAALTLVPGGQHRRPPGRRLEPARGLLGRRPADEVPSGAPPFLCAAPPAAREPRGRGPARERAVRVLLVMKHQGDAGNTHAVANYMRLAPRFGHSVAIFGTPSGSCRSCSSPRTSAASTASSTSTSRSSTASSA